MTFAEWKKNKRQIARSKKIGSVIDWFIMHCRDPEPEQDESHAATRYAQAKKTKEDQPEPLSMWQVFGSFLLILLAALGFGIWVIVMFFAQTPGSHP